MWTCVWCLAGFKHPQVKILHTEREKTNWMTEIFTKPTLIVFANIQVPKQQRGSQRVSHSLFCHFRGFELDLLLPVSSTSFFPAEYRLIKQQRLPCIYYLQHFNCCHSAGLICCRPAGNADMSALNFVVSAAAGPGDDPELLCFQKLTEGRWARQRTHANNETWPPLCIHSHLPPLPNCSSSVHKEAGKTSLKAAGTKPRLWYFTLQKLVKVNFLNIKGEKIQSRKLLQVLQMSPQTNECTFRNN